jgi:hypothetical protein
MLWRYRTLGTTKTKTPTPSAVMELASQLRNGSKPMLIHAPPQSGSLELS